MDIEGEIRTVKAELQLTRANMKHAFGEFSTTLHTAMSAIMSALQSLQTSFSNLEHRIDDHLDRFDRFYELIEEAHSGRLLALETGQDDLRKRVDALEKKKP